MIQKHSVPLAHQDELGFATPVEAAKFLRLSKAMVHKLIGEGKMPACRYGRAVRIPWNWLRAQANSKQCPA
jgi:excisionase family DNA binding protein